jgi:hypothetical protein
MSTPVFGAVLHAAMGLNRVENLDGRSRNEAKEF